MALFKNGVGRPSNEIKRKRKIAYLIIGCVCILLMLGLAMLVRNTSLLKGATKNELKSVKYCSGYAGTSVLPCRKRDRYVIDNLTENSLKIQYVFYRAGDVAGKDGKQGHDGVIDGNDEDFILRFSVATDKPQDDIISKLADVNGDGKITSKDADILSRMYEKYYCNGICGDANSDGKIDNADKKIFYDHIYKNMSISQEQRKKMDVNGDNKIDKSDYLSLSYFGGSQFCLTTGDVSSCNWKEAGYISNDTWTTYNDLSAGTKYTIYVKSFTGNASKLGTVTTKGILPENYNNTTTIARTISMPQYNNSEMVVGKTVGKFKISVSPSTDKVYLESNNPSVIQIMKYGDNSSSKNSWGLKVKKAGKAIITARTSGGKTVSYTYTVNDNGNKTYNVTFVVNSLIETIDGAKTNKNLTRSCVATSDGCKITVPKVTLDSSGTIDKLFWSTKGSELENEVTPGSDIVVKKNETYYLYSKVYNRAMFWVEDKSAGNIVGYSYGCYAINNKTCTADKENSRIEEIYADNLDTNRFTAVAGYTTSKVGNSVEYKSGPLKLSGNVDYYSILKNPKTVTLTLNGNGSDFNTITKKFDIKRADGKDVSSYKLPMFNNNCSSSKYWCNKTDCSDKKYYVNEPIAVSSNMTLYATNYYWGKNNFGVLSLGERFKVGNITVDVEKGIDSSKIKNLYNALYKSYPVLFIPDGKVNVLTTKSYENRWGTSSSGMTYYGYPYVSYDAKYDSNLNENESIVVHEFTHNMDSVHKAYYNISISDSDVYNKLYEQNKDIFGDASKASSSEFLAEMSRYWYQKKFKNQISAQRYFYGSGYSTQRIEKLINEFNNYINTTTSKMYQTYVQKSSGKKYTIKYDANGGNMDSLTEYRLQGSHYRVTSKKPTRSGYTFWYWSETKDAAQAQNGWHFNSMYVYNPNNRNSNQIEADKNYTLYAQWKKADGTPSNQTTTKVATPNTKSNATTTKANSGNSAVVQTTTSSNGTTTGILASPFDSGKSFNSYVSGYTYDYSSKYKRYCGSSKTVYRSNSGYECTFHGGNDYASACNTNLYAVDGGVVKYLHTSSGGGIGLTIGIENTYNGKKYLTLYQHLNKIGVRMNQVIKKGELIGKTGNTGNVRCHLHLEIIKGNDINKYKLDCANNRGNCNYRTEAYRVNPYDYIAGSKKGKNYFTQ